MMHTVNLLCVLLLTRACIHAIETKVSHQNITLFPQVSLGVIKSL